MSGSSQPIPSPPTRAQPSLFEICDDLGIHLTYERLRIVQVLEDADRPLKVSEIRGKLGDAGFRTTDAAILRLLRELRARGAVRGAHAQDGEAFEKRALEARVEMVNRADGSRTVVTDPALIAQIQRTLRRSGQEMLGRIVIQVETRED